MLMAAFGIIVVLYETNDWSDLRTLAPFLWLVLAYLITNTRSSVDGAARGGGGHGGDAGGDAGAAAHGMFAEPAHFEKPEYSEDLAKTIAEYLIPTPTPKTP